jgi:thioredoxin-related protein
MLKSLMLAVALCVAGALPAGAFEMGDDGLHKEDWWSLTFRDVAEDIETAREEGKRLVIVYEQRGCIYCRKMHEELLAVPEIRDYIEANFMVVQYNLYGDEEVTDLDGEVLTEKTAARKWGLIFTPTIIFLPDEVSRGKPVNEVAVATMPGAFETGTFRDMFHWVREKRYETDEEFQRYHARMLEKRREAGTLVTD